ncbi:MAG TPA: isoleucine--tRNA ligase [Actinomycetota bacterium]|nr:isoleucine--tRNA ligase [Actinomycetota bacterium]
MPRYRPVDPRVDFPQLEERVLAFWRERDVFRKTIEQREGAPEWVFYEGPPTANGKPGIHHVLSRAFKDVFPRYRTMTGYSVPRKGGWDCHGLPVELEVEKEIGVATKRDIEEFGIAEFNRRCRDSVTRYVKDWERLTERIAFWLDLSDAYRTMDPDYVQSVWWSLKELHRKDLLAEDFKIVPWCPRCETSLSDHEVSMGYTQVTDPSVFVRFTVTEGDLEGAHLVGWTTTPWTLISNTGVAVHPDEEYAVVERDGERLVLAEGRREELLGEDAAPVERLPGARLVGLRYAPLFDTVEGEGVYRVVGADFVSMDDGSGIVHLSPAFGAEDLEIGRREGWPVLNPVDDRGRFTDAAPGFVRERFVKDADPDIVADLEARGLLVRAGTIEHTYPLCWRCSTPLIYYARTSWYVLTTRRKADLLAANENVGWYPDHIKHGRYGNWLENNVDWALSRARYWGTPLPVWRCDEGHDTVVGSLEELSRLAGRDVTSVDPHRPDIDEVEIACPDCGGEARRLPDVIDAWYDSGAMPFAQWGYHPDLGRGQEMFERRYPADFICEAVDQTRGWFYSLMAEGVLLFDESAYRNCLVLGLIVDKDGRKMSKSLGNVIDPWTIIGSEGADALRWYLFTAGPAWQTRRVFPEAVRETLRRFLLTLWNTYSFFVTYATIDDVDPAADPVPPGERPVLDRWIRSRLHGTIRAAREGLEGFDATAAARAIDGLVDDLSNWYVRRARRRFWDPAGPDDDRDKAAAFATLHECLTTIATLLAPFTPFVAEELHQNLVAGTDPAAPESVHLADYPEAHEEALDPGLEESMSLARAAASLGRAARTEAGVRVRQPLARAVVHLPGDGSALTPLLDLVSEELNVKEVDLTSSAEELSGWRAKPSFRELGPKLGPRVQEVAAALEADDGSLAGALASGETVQVELPSGPVELATGDVELRRQTREGWGVASEGGVTVALDLELTEALRLEGLAREVVRAVQDARKGAGLDVADRIDLALRASGDLERAIEAHEGWIRGEVLAVSLGDPRADGQRSSVEIEGAPVEIWLRRAG